VGVGMVRDTACMDEHDCFRLYSILLGMVRDTACMDVHDCFRLYSILLL